MDQVINLNDLNFRLRSAISFAIDCSSGKTLSAIAEAIASVEEEIANLQKSDPANRPATYMDDD